MNHRTVLLLVISLFFHFNILGQTTKTDSLSYTLTTHPDTLLNTDDNPERSKMERFSSSKLFRMTYVGVPLIICGQIINQDYHFRSLRNDYIPKFRHHIDDYVQYAPAAIMLGMKVAGVQGRSNWGRMLTSDAFSAAIMATAVNSLKYSVKTERPDGSNRHSFPSGHTATVFMTATMLAKEYGHLSPWVGIGAYSMATATGLMRMANNKHWLSDVMTGAGIGIIATELGYYLADLIFKDRGITNFDTMETLDRYAPPSFIGLYLGINLLPSGYNINNEYRYGTSSGSNAGIEGAWFGNAYFGVGGRLTISDTNVLLNYEQTETAKLDAVKFLIGPYFSKPLSVRWALGTKLIGGVVHYPTLHIGDHRIPKNDAMCFSTGVTMTFKARKHLGFRLFIDYDLQQPHSKLTREWMHMLTFGGSCAAILK